jgi:hypothetical protein
MWRDVKSWRDVKRREEMWSEESTCFVKDAWKVEIARNPLFSRNIYGSRPRCGEPCLRDGCGERSVCAWMVQKRSPLWMLRGLHLLAIAVLVDVILWWFARQWWQIALELLPIGDAWTVEIARNPLFGKTLTHKVRSRKPLSNLSCTK